MLVRIRALALYGIGTKELILVLNASDALQGPGAIAPQPDEADIEEFLSTIRDYPTPPREYFDIEAKV